MKIITRPGSVPLSRKNRPYVGTTVKNVFKKFLSALMLAFFVLTQLAYPFIEVAQAQELGRSAPTNVVAATSTKQLDVIVSTSTTGLVEYTATANESADTNLILQEPATVVVAESIASTSSSTDSNVQTAVADEPNFQDILAYLRELQMMDKSELSKAEKEELKAIKREAKEKIEGIDLKNVADTELRALKLDKKSKERDLKNALGEVDLKKKKGKELTVEQKELQKLELDKAKKKKLKEALVIQTEEFESLVEVNAVLREQYFAEIEATLTEEERMHAEIPDAPVVFVTDEVYSTDDYLLDSQPEVFLELYAQSESSTPPIVVDRPIIVAVIDAGVDHTHEDLQGMMWRSDICASYEGDRLPQSCENGYDFVGNDYNPAPTDGSEHGTGVASMIAAMSGNGLGISSLSANRARIMSLRVADNGYIYSDTLVKAIYFAVYNGADIINMSLSGPAYNQEFADAVAYAQTMGVVVVASAGNAGLNIDETPVYPASLPGVITVGAADTATSIASWSNFGETVDLVAPGNALLGAGSNNTYRGYTGTSFSAPMVTSLLVRKISEGVAPAEFIANLPSDDNFAGKSFQGKVLESVQFLNGVPLSESDSYIAQVDGTYTSTLGKGGEYELVATAKDSSLGFASPITPGKSSSGNANTIPTGSVKFTWSKAATIATQYGLYVRDTVTNALVVDQDNLGKVYMKSIAGSTFVVGRKYKWNTGVSKTNTAQSSATNYSDPLYFIYGTPTTGADTTTGTTGSVPVAPSLTFGTVANPGTRITSTVQTISWPTVAGATRYEFQLFDLTNNPAGSSVGSYTGSGNSTDRDFLVNGHFYKYQVRAKNSYGWGEWSAFRFFYVQFGSGSYPPPSTVTPSHTSPPGNPLTSTTYQVSWQNTGAPQYNLTWSKKQADGSYCYTVSCGGGDRFISGTSYTIDNLVSGGNYRFDVASCPSVGGCTNSTARSNNSYFYVSGTANIPPAEPTVTLQGAAVPNKTTYFTIKTSDADGDQVLLEIDWDGNSTLDTIQTINPASYTDTYSKTFTSSKTYCVKARAKDKRAGGAQYSVWSDCTDVVVTTQTLADIVPISMSVSSDSLRAGDTVNVSYSIKNIGTKKIAAGTVIKNDLLLGAFSTGVVTGGRKLVTDSVTLSTDLLPGQTLPLQELITLPGATDSIYAQSSKGSFFLFVDLNVDKSFNEISSDNNSSYDSGIGGAVIAVNTSSATNGIAIDLVTGTKSVGTNFNITLRTNLTPSQLQNNPVYLSADGYIITPNQVSLTSGVKTMPVKLTGGTASKTRIRASIPFPTQKSFTSNYIEVVPPGVSTGQAVFRVTTAGRLPYANKDVRIFVSKGNVTLEQDYVTDANGVFYININQVFGTTLGTVRIGAVVNKGLPDEEVYKSSRTIQIISNKTVYDEIEVSLKHDFVHDPIIFLPGLMGSTMKNDSYAGFYNGIFMIGELPSVSPLPYLTEDVDAGELKVYEGISNNEGFKTLRNELKDLGYVEGETLIDCPYDWRDPSLENAKTFLRDCIDSALRNSPKDGRSTTVGKVDIVAHSMGGIVARSLLQHVETSGEDYAKRVKSVSFVGTPHEGAAMAYPIYEAGDLTKDPGNAFHDWGVKTVVFSSASRSFVGEEGELFLGLFSFGIPGVITVDGNTLLTIGNVIQGSVAQTTGMQFGSYAVRKHTQEKIPSLKELLPTYDGAITSSSGISCHENRYLKALNSKNDSEASACYRAQEGYVDDFIAYYTTGVNIIEPLSASVNRNGIKLANFYGGDISKSNNNWSYDQRSQAGKEWTRHTYPVGTPPGVQSGEYQDGKIPENYKSLSGASSGDGTVPVKSSAGFAERQGTAVFKINKGITASHNALVSAFRGDIISFITGETYSVSSLDALETPTVTIGVSGRYSTRLISAGGQYAGVTDASTSQNTTTQVSDFTISETSSEYILEDAQAGTYTLRVYGGEPGAFSVGINFNYAGLIIHRMYEGYSNGGVYDLVLSIDPSATEAKNVINITSVGPTVTGVTIAKSGDGKSELSWTAPVGVSVQKYKVYSRPVVNPTLVYLGETTGITYSTGVSWGGIDNEATRRFQVSAVLTNGVETFLSEPVFDNDVDGDLLIDSIEVSIGTNPAVKDTDGDGRDDAQEYFVDKTNPLVVDQAPSMTTTTEIPVTDGVNITQAYGANPFSLGAVFTATSSANTYGTLVMGTLIGPRKFASLSMQADGKLHAEIAYHNTSGTNVGSEFVTTQAYKDGVKHYVELTAHNKTSTTSEIVLYVDGAEVKRQTAAHAFNFSTPLTNYRVGEFQLYTTSALSNSFKGVIDRAVTFVGTRTPETIMQTKNLYLNTASSSSPGIPLIGSQINDGSGTSTIFATSSLAIGSWFTASSTGSYGVLASGAKGDNSRNFLALWFLPDGRVGAELGANVNMEMYSTSTWANQAKHYAEFTLANVGAQKVGALYIDGLLRASATTSGNYNLPTFARWQLGEFTGLGATGVQHQFSGVRGEAHSAHIVTGVRTASDIFAYYNSIVNPTPPAPPVVTTIVTDGANIATVIGSQSYGLGSWFKTGSVSQESALVGATHSGTRSFTVLKIRTDGKVVGELGFIDAQGNNQGVEMVSANTYTDNTLHYAEMIVKNLGVSVEVKLYVDGVLAGTQTLAGSYTLAQYDSWNTKRMMNWSNGSYNMAYGGALGAQYFYLGERSIAQSLATFQSGNPITLNEFNLDSVSLDPAPVATSTTSGAESNYAPSAAPTSESETPANNASTLDISASATLPESPAQEPVTDTVVQ